MSTTRGRSADLTHSAAVRQLNKAVTERGNAAVADRGRLSSVSRGSENIRAVTRRPASVESRDTSVGRQSSSEDPPEDEEDSSTGVEARLF